jgi:hypothetical protein
MRARHFRPLRGAIGVLALSGLVTAGLVTSTATPAAAATGTLTRSSVVYVDSAAPGTSVPAAGGDVPVGAFRAGHVVHVSKAYVTFDLSALNGSRLLSAHLSADETAVTDCTKARGTQVWLTTASAHSPTWRDQPREIVKVPGPSSAADCPAAGLRWDATHAIRDALHAGRSTATFVLRLPAAEQSDPAFARRYSTDLRLTFDDNHTPDAPGQVALNDHACTAKPLPVDNSALKVTTNVHDVDLDALTVRVTYWPVRHPDRRTVLTTDNDSESNHATVYLDPTTLTDGVTYRLEVRSDDGVSVSPPSAICEFTADFTAPAAAPTVSSADYPTAGPATGSGGTGVPGTFTFSANGDKNVVGFYYSVVDSTEQDTYVAADHRGGTATVRYAPTNYGPNILDVVGVDAAGNRSPLTAYRYQVVNNSPTVSCTPVSAVAGVARQCVLAPGAATGVVGYVYWWNDGARTTVPVDTDGGVTVTVTPPSNPATFQAEAELSNGNLTAASDAVVTIYSDAPLIDQSTLDAVIGSTVHFTFHAVLAGSVTFTYVWNDDAAVTIPVGADGTATVSEVVTETGIAGMSAFTTTADGVDSATANTYLAVEGNQPTVTSTDYPEDGYGGAVYQPGTFTFSSPVPGAVSYTYSFNDDAPTTVPAGADGTADVVFTPTQTGNTLTVTSTFGDGTRSDQMIYTFYANSIAPDINCGIASPAPGQVVACTFIPVQRDVVSYTYFFDTGSYITIPADPDGTATVYLTMPDISDYYTAVLVSSTDSSGVQSDQSFQTFHVGG